MRPHYPRSFFKLLSIAFAVVALPLVLVLLGNALSIQQLSTEGQRAVHQAARITQAARALAETLTSLERAGRQYAVLGDPALLEAFANAQREAENLAAQLSELPLSPAQRQDLDRVLEEQQAIVAALNSLQRGPALDAALGRFAILAEASQAMVDHNRAAVQETAEALQSLASEAASLIYRQILVLLPLTVLLVAGFSVLINRPIRQIDQGIRGLGEGRFAEPIEVSGPADLEILGKRLDWLRLRLVELEAQKNRFLRHTSHELKTPLTALREGSELLVEEVTGPLTPGQREIATILRDNSRRLSQQIEDLLRYSASDFHNTALRLQACRPAEIVDAVLATQALPLSTRRIRVDRRLDDFVLLADPERLRVIVDNLLSNALKFSPEDATIEIVARVVDGEAWIEVADQGPGVADADREYIFEPFYRGRQPSEGTLVKGSGLGLSIVREHVLAHGGRVELLAGPGSRFRVAIPLKTSD